MKKSFILCVIFAGILALGGCGEEKTPKTEAVGWTQEDLPPAHIEERIHENVLVDADVTVLPGFESGIADILLARSNSYDAEKIKEILSEDYPIVHTETQEWADGSKTENHELRNGYMLHIDDEFINYRGELSDYLGYCIRLSYGQVDENRAVFEAAQEDFSYCSMEEAEEACRQWIERLELPGELDVWDRLRLPHELLAQEEDVLVMEHLPEETQPKPKEQWAAEDDCYCFQLYSLVNGCGVVPEVYSAWSERLYTPPIGTIILNEKGIVQFTSYVSFSGKEVLQEKQPLIDFQTALETVRKKYEHLITEDELEIVEIALGYIGLRESAEEVWEQNMQMRPAWVFRGKKTTEVLGQENTSAYQVVVDAVTGEELL